MGKKGKWFSNLKKAFSPDSMKFRHNVPQYHNGVISDPVLVETVKTSPPPFEVIVVQNKNECSSSADVSASAAADIPEVSSQSALEVVNCAKPAHITGKSIDEAATIMIQTAFRGYLARRALRALRGLVRLKSLMEEPVMKRQVANTLKCMQTLSHVQSQIQTRRIRMSEENQARQKQLLQKNAIELANLRNGDDWDDSLQSKEQVEANILSRYEAAMRRERALAYAYSHQVAPIVAGMAVAAAAYASKYGMEAWQAFKARPPRPRIRRFYDGGFQSTMTRREAALILGVRESTAREKVREAHRRVMVANHPDAGGSNYLASKVNEAKDIMLGRSNGSASAF
ncbi:PREDICTED: protein IQ-DOMAIN 1-like isoform X2 [Tarenaya hassleriana]|uniref:protein IQ-DOMAIN 1-like isoform X2 n=1 Tax=Tarenaya hassleriana TaxID=28532 RepID=UPI00053C0A40|nr:PREDICTED: protein IQ-DOMAIN 1-like isoform X2 [Tarenaya hassleriana]